MKSNRIFQEKLILVLMYDFEGFETFMEEVAVDVVETAREPRSEVEPEDVTESPQFHSKTLMDEELLLIMSKESAFLRWNLLLEKIL